MRGRMLHPCELLWLVRNTVVRAGGKKCSLTTSHGSRDMVARFIRRLICGKVVVGKQLITRQEYEDAPELYQGRTAKTELFHQIYNSDSPILIRPDSCNLFVGDVKYLISHKVKRSFFQHL